MFGTNPKRGRKTGNASIRENFDDFSDDETEIDTVSAISVPGPGSYLKETSTFGKSTVKSESFQFFGSGVERFKHPNGSNSLNAFQNNLGPGCYNSTHQPSSIR